jgi:tRNA pseudouridine55 synthase
MTQLSGVINLDKPPGMSSAKAVDKVKHLLPRGTKIGHAGTLDPFATGVLLLLVGRATRLCERLMDQPKQYEATVKLGATTATDDPESPEEPGDTGVPPVRATDANQRSTSLFQSDTQHGQDARVTGKLLHRDDIVRVLPQFIGAIQQRPPAFSAMKIAGRRAYELARDGKSPQLQPRTVNVYKIDLLDFAWPLLRLRIDCGRGTYIRAIARDLGAALGVGGYLTQLRRTRSGEFAIDSSVTLERLGADGVPPHLRPIDPPPASSAQ